MPEQSLYFSANSGITPSRDVMENAQRPPAPESMGRLLTSYSRASDFGSTDYVLSDRTQVSDAM